MRVHAHGYVYVLHMSQSMCGGLRTTFRSSFYTVGLRDGTQVIRLSGRAPLSAEPSCWPLSPFFFKLMLVVNKVKDS